MAIDYEALWREAHDAYTECAVQSFGADDQAAATVLRDAFAAELADRDRTIAERDAEIGRLRDMASSAIDLADGLHEGHDYLGTGSDSKSADKEYASDAKRIADFRAALGDRHHD